MNGLDPNQRALASAAEQLGELLERAARDHDLGDVPRETWRRIAELAAEVARRATILAGRGAGPTEPTAARWWRWPSFRLPRIRPMRLSQARRILWRLRRDMRSLVLRLTSLPSGTPRGGGLVVLRPVAWALTRRRSASCVS